jgi:negative regulator of flagellin synthesis FlgM
LIISNNKIQNVLKVYAEQNSVAKSAKADKNRNVQQQDEVILSSGVQEFGQIFQRIIATSDVRPEKVNELSAKINSGNYQINSKDIADKIIGRTLNDD